MNIKPCMSGVLLVATLSGWAQAAVFGDDDRRKLTPSEATYPVREALGRLTCRHPGTGRKLVGTAAIVDTGTADAGHEVLLTAAHVVIDPATGAPLDDCRFKAEGRFWGSDPVVDIRTGEFDGSAQTNPKDWAMLIIAVSRPAAFRLPIWSSSGAPERVVLVGYRGDRRGLWVSDDCFARPAAPGEALHNERVWLSDCDATPGSSGAPLLAWGRGRWHWSGLYRGHLYDPLKHQPRPNQLPEFSGMDAMNVIVLWPQTTHP
tara:strand:+ start:3187 stop:3969 length:783 start_codon:yes stop_codon:yes gene_type:complete